VEALENHGRKKGLMIPARRLQLSFADGFIAEQVDDLWEPWMGTPIRR
jgi:hypothetical protein